MKAMNMIQAAKNQVAALTQAAYERCAAQGLLPAGAEIQGVVEIPKDTKNGDYASSFAMAGARALKMAPRAIAQAILTIWSWKAPTSAGRRWPDRAF